MKTVFQGKQYFCIFVQVYIQNKGGIPQNKQTNRRKQAKSRDLLELGGLHPNKDHLLTCLKLKMGKMYMGKNHGEFSKQKEVFIQTVIYSNN